MQLSKLMAILFATNLIAACSSNDTLPYEGYDDDYTVYEEEIEDDAKIENELTLREATEQVIMDIRGKENAASYLNYQKRIVQCGEMIPGRIMGGSIQIPQEGCITNQPGSFIDSSTIRLPLEGGQ